MLNFKKWFSKDVKSQSQQSNNLPIELSSYILLGYDKNNNDLAIVYFPEGEHEKIANLMFYLISGLAIDGCMDALKKSCHNNEELEYIIQMITKLLNQIPQQNVAAPVIDPCNVFSKGKRNEFKG